MTTLIFYKKPVAIDRVAHLDLKLKFQAKGFNYASSTNSVPVTTAEFGSACKEYPIVFITDENGGGLPVVLTGLRDAENLFVNAEGKWDASYVPAFVCRYPFILQTNNNGEFSVLLDSEADGFDAENGDRLFNEDGTNSPMLDQVLKSLDQFRVFADHTAEFVKQLRKLDLLMPRVITAVTNAGEKFNMNGFSVIDESRLNALDDADLLSLARNGYLAGIHAHMISLSNIQALLARLELSELIG